MSISLIGPYEPLRCVGKGSSGVVCVAVDTASPDKKHVALKMVLREQMSCDRAVYAEAKREYLALQKLKDLNHRNIVSLRDAFAKHGNAYLVLDLATGGNLFALVQRERSQGRKGLPELWARKLFHQVLEGLLACHGRGVAHLDIKPNNILLDGVDGTAMICDFGHSAVMDKSLLLRGKCGTRSFRAPEVCDDGPPFNPFKADIWSCGATLHYLLTGEIPFVGQSVVDLSAPNATGCYVVPKSMSGAAGNLISRMLVVDPMGRATLEDLLTDAWFERTPSMDLDAVASTAGDAE